MKDTMTGNRALLRIAGKTVGSGVQSADFQDSFGTQRVYGLGSAEAQELVIGAVEHTINLSSYMVSGQDLVALGFVPDSTEWLTSGALEIEIQDAVSGATLELYAGCKASTHSRSYQKNIITGQQATFFGLAKLPNS